MTTAFLDQHRRFLESRGASTPWLAELRQSGIQKFETAGFPTPRDEAWRFTSLKALEKQTFEHMPEAGVIRSGEVQGDVGIVFSAGDAPVVTGSGGGIEVQSLAEAAKTRDAWLQEHLGALLDLERHRFAALNTAYLDQGVVVRIGKESRKDTVIHLCYQSVGNGSPPVSYPRVLVVAEPGTETALIEEYSGSGEGCYFTNAVTEVFVGANAHIHHIKLQRETREAFHLGCMAVRLGRDSRFTGHSLALGARLSRSDIDVTLEGEGGECTLNGLYVTRDRQHVDHHTRVEHVAPHTSSHEHYKGVLDDRASGVFNGRLVIHPDAQKVEASQTNNNLLLSRDALINTNPELEIFADDVKAQHGATIGQLDDEHLFYLRSRGLTADEARRILIHGFTGEMVERIPVETLRQELTAHLSEVF